MLLSTFNPTQISNAVWTAAARTLTADPATNLGAAKLVWDRTTVAPAAGGFGALVNLNLDAKVSLTALAATALSTAVWTGGRATNLDNLDATVSSRAASATALSTATWTGGRATNLDNLDATISSRLSAIINSVQQGTITISGSNSTATATITSVNTAKSHVIFLGTADDTAIGTQGLAYLALTNATTVTATRNVTSNSTTVAYVVVEYK